MAVVAADDASDFGLGAAQYTLAASPAYTFRPLPSPPSSFPMEELSSIAREHGEYDHAVRENVLTCNF